MIMNSKSTSNAPVHISYHWRTLNGNSWLTRYFYKITQQYLEGTLGLAETLLQLCRLMRIVPLHLYICVASYSVLDNGWLCETQRYYGVSEGNAVHTDGGVFGRNRTLAWLPYLAFTPGNWIIKYAIDPTNCEKRIMLNWECSGVTPIDIRAIAKRLKLGKSNNKALQLAYRKISEALANPQNSCVSHRECLTVTEFQLSAMDTLIRRCQQDFHYKLIGNNCQNVAHDIVEMLRKPSYTPNWVPRYIHSEYLTELKVGI